MVNCPSCGYKDPFMRSWYHPDKEVAEPEYFEPWNSELWKQLLKCDVIVGEFHYHLTRTKRTVERWNKAIDKVGFAPLEATHRRNLHIRRKEATTPA
jgi:hypothetical protein